MMEEPGLSTDLTPDSPVDPSRPVHQVAEFTSLVMFGLKDRKLLFSVKYVHRTLADKHTVESQDPSLSPLMLIKKFLHNNKTDVFWP